MQMECPRIFQRVIIPGEHCEPLGVPVQFNGTHYYPFHFIVLPDRIYQLFEKQLERRTIWLNRDHRSDLFPSYFGDSVGKWEGNTLVVDTIGFNGEALVDQRERRALLKRCDFIWSSVIISSMPRIWIWR